MMAAHFIYSWPAVFVYCQQKNDQQTETDTQSARQTKRQKVRQSNR